ncbi:MAG: ankyrin repeat domain-containing protein [Desulfomonile tiedjei]|uniref:Ankyrin repeat domain-containing protein n=1 Tax=Desulfomonile tiedjei TaxID=2358 RepID=A0A9D6V5R5_9BACT|nr:ankyrin repeat domain-containing protein [Desulfomonile tiedjei]
MRERHIAGILNGCEQLMEAAQKGAIAQVDRLLSRGVSLDCRDDNRRTFTILAAENGNAGLLGVAIRHNADLNVADNDGETALMKAVYGRHRDVAELLISNGADRDLRNNEGMTALEIAQEMEYDDMVDLFSSQFAGPPIPVEEKISMDPDDDGPTTDGPAGAVGSAIAAAVAASPEPRSYVQKLDLESIPEVADSPFFKRQPEPEAAQEQQVNETETEQNDSIVPTGESAAGAPKPKPTVSQMVATVKTFLVTYVIMGLEAIGDYLLENVFDGNYKKALSKDPYKGTSLSDIADHKDMPLSRQRLGECVRVAAETQELKSFGLESDFLTYYHKLEISRVKSPEERLKLAQEANGKALTVREVRDRVRKLTGKAVSADKRMAQAVIKQLGVFSQMTVDEETREFLKDKDRLKEALTTGETAKLLDHSEKFREAVGESEEILHRLEKTLVEIVVERRQEDETDSE